MCQSVREPSTRTPPVEFLHVLFLLPSLPQAATTRRSAARSMQRKRMTLPRACTLQFFVSRLQPPPPTPLARWFMWYTLLLLYGHISIILYTYMYYLLLYVQWTHVGVCMVCVCTYTYYYIYIYNMSYVGLSRGPLSTYGEMFTFLHLLPPSPDPFTMFVLIWELIIWILQISTQILLYVQRFD